LSTWSRGRNGEHHRLTPSDGMTPDQAAELIASKVSSNLRVQLNAEAVELILKQLAGKIVPEMVATVTRTAETKIAEDIKAFMVKVTSSVDDKVKWFLSDCLSHIDKALSRIHVEYARREEILTKISNTGHVVAEDLKRFLSGCERSLSATSGSLLQGSLQVAAKQEEASETMRTAARAILDEQRLVIQSTKTASVESLTAIIGDEISRLELRKMIGEQVAAAVREAFQQMRTP
jgi:hypothetical protein